MNNLCAIKNCPKERSPKDKYCSMHRARITRHRDPQKLIGLNCLSLRERFEKQFVKDKSSGCWLWIGTTKKNGYGILQDKGMVRHAHRVSFEMFNGSIPTGSVICHSCDNRKCVNPSHLWCGSQADNLRDARLKGRMPYKNGE